MPLTEEVEDEVIHSDGTFDGVMPYIASHAEFYKTASTGNVAIVKGMGDAPQQFLLTGIFKIDRQNFFMEPEGNYSPSNTFNCNFINTKLTCNLIPVQAHCEIASGLSNFNAFVVNIKAVEKIIPLKWGFSMVSSVCEVNGQSVIRLTHSLFVVRDPPTLLYYTVRLLTGVLHRKRMMNWG